MDSIQIFTFEKSLITFLETIRNDVIIISEGLFYKLRISFSFGSDTNKDYSRIKTKLINIFRKNSSSSYKFLSSLSFISSWLDVCEEEIEEFKEIIRNIQYKDIPNNKYDDKLLSYIFNWYFNTVITHHAKEGLMATEPIKYKMIKKMAIWCQDQPRENILVNDDTNPIYKLTGAEYKMLKLMLKNNESNFQKISNEQIEKQLRRTKQHVQENYNLDNIHFAYQFMEYVYEELSSYFRIAKEKTVNE